MHFVFHSLERSTHWVFLSLPQSLHTCILAQIALGHHNVTVRSEEEFSPKHRGIQTDTEVTVVAPHPQFDSRGREATWDCIFRLTMDRVWCIILPTTFLLTAFINYLIKINICTSKSLNVRKDVFLSFFSEFVSTFSQGPVFPNVSLSCGIGGWQRMTQRAGPRILSNPGCVTTPT